MAEGSLGFDFKTKQYEITGSNIQDKF